MDHREGRNRIERIFCKKFFGENPTAVHHVNYVEKDELFFESTTVTKTVKRKSRMTRNQLKWEVERMCVKVMRNVFTNFFRLDPNSEAIYSKDTMVQSFVSYYFDENFKKSSIERRVDEKKILDEEYDDNTHQNLFFKFKISEKEFVIPFEIFREILSFLKYDKSTFSNVGSVSKDFYIAILSNVPCVKIRYDSLFEISLLSLRTTRKIDMCNCLCSFTSYECDYLLENLKMNTSIRTFDFSLMRSYMNIFTKFLGKCASKGIVFSNCTKFKFTKNMKRERIMSMEKLVTKEKFSEDFKSTFPNLTSLANPPYPELVKLFENKLIELSFHFSERYEERGFDGNTMYKILDCQKNIRRFTISYFLNTKLTIVQKDSVFTLEEILNISRFVSLFPLLEHLTISTEVNSIVQKNSLIHELSTPVFPVSHFPNLKSLEYICERGLEFCGKFGSFFSSEILDKIQVLSVQNIEFETLERSIREMRSFENLVKKCLEIRMFRYYKFDFSRFLLLLKRFSHVRILGMYVGFIYNIWHAFGEKGCGFKLIRKWRELCIYTKSYIKTDDFGKELFQVDTLKKLLKEEFVLSEFDSIAHFYEEEYNEKKTISNRVLPTIHVTPEVVIPEAIRENFPVVSESLRKSGKGEGEVFWRVMEYKKK